jgi:hypothetical protein
MSALEIVRLVLLVIHLVGLAAIVGPFILQRSRKSGFEFAPMLVGSIAQLLSGAALIGVRKAEELAVIEPKMAVKLGIAVVVLIVVLVAVVRQRRIRQAGGSDARLRPLLVLAGLLAIADIVVAVFWH